MTHPFEMLGQSLTNMMTPATQQLAQALRFPPSMGALMGGGGSSAGQQRAPELTSSALFSSPSNTKRNYAGAPLLGARGQPAIESMEPEPMSSSNVLSLLMPRPVSPPGGSGGGGSGGGGARAYAAQSGPSAQGMNSILELSNTLASTFLGGGGGGGRSSRGSSTGSYSYAEDEERGSRGSLWGPSGGGGGGGLSPRAQSSGGSSSYSSMGRGLMPTLKQFFPDGDRNFGLPSGEGCLPFVGEFMRMIYGNCVRQADQRTWDAWGKEITNALMGGKIDLLRASKETCKKGAEREQCGQLRKAVSECDIIGSIQLASNMQRAVARCDEISGIMDQNPMTVVQQMQGLINGEVAQGFLNNFLG